MNLKRILAVSLSLALAFVLVTGAAAASVHLKGGRHAEPSFTDNGLSLEAFAELAGLGNGDVFISMMAWAEVTSTCTNNGGNAAPGQNPAPIKVSGAVTIPEEEVKNGHTPFTVETEPPPSEIPGAPDCPNPNWAEFIDDLAFTSATIIVEQPEGTVVLVVECTFDPSTSNGSVDKREVSCQQFH